MLSRIAIFIFATTATFCLSQEGDISPDKKQSDGRLKQVLNALTEFRHARKGTTEQKAAALQRIRNNTNWVDTLWPHVVDITRQGLWSIEDEANYASRRASALKDMNVARSDKGGFLSASDPSAVLYKAIQNEKYERIQGRKKLGEFIETLTALPSDEAVQILGPLLEAKGLELGGDDSPVSPPQILAVVGLTEMQLNNLAFKGSAPGANEIAALNNAAERSARGESVVMPSFSYGLQDWRKWWKATKGQYKSQLELPNDLREVMLSTVPSSGQETENGQKEAASVAAPSLSKQLPESGIASTTPVSDNRGSARWGLLAVAIGVLFLVGIIILARRKSLRK